MLVRKILDLRQQRELENLKAENAELLHRLTVNEAQTFWTAMETDTLIEEEDDENA